jgi:cytochrome c biogenesis protein
VQLDRRPPGQRHQGGRQEGAAQRRPVDHYKLRDASGQAREFHNYMLPVELDGQRVFLLGLRDTPQEPFRYLRIPADDQGQLDGWVRLRQALMDPDLRDKAARRYAAQSAPADKPEWPSSCC